MQAAQDTQNALDGAGPGYVAGQSGRVLVICWRGSPTARDFAEFDPLVAGLAAQHPGGIAVLVVIERDNTSPPAPTARRAQAALTEKYQRDLRGIATVLLGTSVKHSMLRFVLSTIQLMSPSQVPQDTFDSVEAASRWLHDRIPAVSAGELASECHKLRFAKVHAKPDPAPRLRASRT
jgi:hypothetical protein